MLEALSTIKTYNLKPDKQIELKLESKNFHFTLINEC